MPRPLWHQARPKKSLQIPEVLSNQVPAEIWQKIAAYTVPRYSISIDGNLNYCRKGPKTIIRFDDKFLDDLFKTRLVSTAFNAGVRIGAVKQFQGIGYTNDMGGKYLVDPFLKTVLAPLVKEVAFVGLMWPWPKELWREIISRQWFPNLERLTLVYPNGWDIDKAVVDMPDSLRHRNSIGKHKLLASKLRPGHDYNLRLTQYAIDNGVWTCVDLNDDTRAMEVWETIDKYTTGSRASARVNTMLLSRFSELLFGPQEQG